MATKVSLSLHSCEPENKGGRRRTRASLLLSPRWVRSSRSDSLCPPVRRPCGPPQRRRRCRLPTFRLPDQRDDGLGIHRQCRQVGHVGAGGPRGERRRARPQGLSLLRPGCVAVAKRLAAALVLDIEAIEEAQTHQANAAEPSPLQELRATVHPPMDSGSRTLGH